MTDTEEIIFSPNSSINNAIKEILMNFNSESQGRMRRAILNAKKSAEKHRDENTDSGARHIFREFIPASILNQHGFSFEYEKSIQRKTPDWLDAELRIMLESYTFERGGSSSLLDRLLSITTDKCIKYKDIIEVNALHFLIAIYIDFLTGITLEDFYEEPKLLCPLFEGNSSLGAILLFTETHAINGKQQYEFLCFYIDPYFVSTPNWPFHTISLLE